MKRLYLAILIAVSVATPARSGDKVRKATMKPAVNRATDIGHSLIIIGQLGLPVGETVLIHGAKNSQPKGSSLFDVDAVNGSKLPKIISIEIPAVTSWPDGTEATIRGHEEGALQFTNIQGSALAADEFVPRQILYIEFKAVTLIEGQRPLDAKTKK